MKVGGEVFSNLLLFRVEVLGPELLHNKLFRATRFKEEYVE